MIRLIQSAISKRIANPTGLALLTTQASQRITALKGNLADLNAESIELPKSITVVPRASEDGNRTWPDKPELIEKRDSAQQELRQRKSSRGDQWEHRVAAVTSQRTIDDVELRLEWLKDDAHRLRGKIRRAERDRESFGAIFDETSSLSPPLNFELTGE